MAKNSFLFSAKHHDNGRECKVWVTRDEHAIMRVFYKGLGYIIDGEIPGPRIASRNRQPRAPKLTSANLLAVIGDTGATDEQKVELLRKLLAC